VTDFVDLFHRLLPGIYRQKDDRGELRQFLEIMAQPPSELEQSIGQLYLDLFVASCRSDFLPFIGDLIGAEVDAAEPASIQRATLATTFAFYRSKGLAVPIARVVQAVSTWSTTPVDYSQVVARLPFVGALSVVVRRRAQPVAEDPGTSGGFYFNRADRPPPPGRTTALYHEPRGRPIARTEIASLAAEVVGTEAGFTIYHRGVPVVGPGAPFPLAVLGADLSDFANPRQPGGAALVVAAGQVAVDPALGRFLMASPLPLLADVTVDFHQLAPGATVPQTFDIRDSARMPRLARADDPAPYTLDLRSPRRPTDSIGRAFYDNHGFFLTVGTAVANQRPNLVHPGTFSGFTFDGRPLAAGDTQGHALQLQDGIDGSPLTRQKLAGNEDAFVDTPRGFTIHDLATSVRDPAFPVAVRIRAADLTDFTSPRDAAGAPLVLAATDVAVDPQRGRFLIDLGALGLPAARVRVGFLLAPASRVTAGRPLALASGSSAFAFAADGALAPLRDAFDGTMLSKKLRLGAGLGDFHGTARGWRVSRNGVDLTTTLAPELMALPLPGDTATPGRLAVDVDRGRFALPAGLLVPGDELTVDFSAEDLPGTARIFERVAQRMPRMMPAGVTPVLLDTRRPAIDPSTLQP
jgi:hypothetical protein